MRSWFCCTAGQKKFAGTEKSDSLGNLGNQGQERKKDVRKSKTKIISKE